MKIIIGCAMGFIFLTSYAVASCDADRMAQITQALDNNKKVLIVAWGEKQACGADDETCGDWASYLNGYTRKKADSLAIFKIPANQWLSVVQIPGTVTNQSTLFMKKEAASYFHKGPIIESDVYSAMESLWKGEASNKEISDVGLTKVQASFCK